MRTETGAACLSWIPPTAVEGAFRLPFGMGIAHCKHGAAEQEGARA